MSKQDFTSQISVDPIVVGTGNANGMFFLSKRLFDILWSFVLLPFFLVSAAVLLILNPFLNKGGLFFSHTRMGKDCKPFQAYKFRSMSASTGEVRTADDPLETDRITWLGRIIRKLRVDELPQILNVFLGDMSIIGPRPDYYDHASEYLTAVPGYRDRHAVRPGISGLAQTEVGYVESIDGTKLKVAADLEYIQNLGFAQEAWIFWRTFVVIFMRAGS